MISERFYDNTVVISIHGAFDGRTAHELVPTVQRAYRMGFREFVFNLQTVTRIDQSGMAQLFFTGHDLRQKGCRRSIVDPPSHIRGELETYNMSTFAPIVSQTIPTQHPMREFQHG